MKPGISLISESSNLLKRLFIYFGILSALALALQLAWMWSDHYITKDRLEKALAFTLEESIRTRDLISIKRTIGGFELAYPGSKICLAMADNVVIGDDKCHFESATTHRVPLSNESFQLEVQIVAFHWMIGVGLLFLLGVWGVVGYIGRRFHWFLSRIKGDLQLLQVYPRRDLYFSELAVAGNEFDKRIELERQNQVLVVSKQLGDLAAQVAHDIRSPLSALSLLTSHLAGIDEDRRTIVRSAVNRINDIANDLIKRAKALQRDNNLASASSGVDELAPPVPAPTLVASLVDTVVSEKRSQFREKQWIDIQADFTHSYGLFAALDVREFQRAVSNLIENAVEAMPEGKGKIVLSLEDRAEYLAVVIRDNGRGIPGSVLAKIGQKGFSFGKNSGQSGSGLGVYHAKKTLADVGGNFVIESEPGHGTTITLELKKARAPKWFVEQLLVDKNSIVLTVDDDISIHQLWRDRFAQFTSNEFSGQLMSFTSANEFRQWVQQSRTNFSAVPQFYLIDYEFLNQGVTGFDLIEELGISEQSILVTSRFDEGVIRDRCEKVGVKTIPKSLAGLVPIAFKE